MKQQKRRWLSVLTVGLLCLNSFSAMPVSAETDGETYENDTIATAEAIDLNTPVTGALSNSSDVDYYAITLDEDGSFSVSFEHPEQSYTNSTYWKISLYDDLGTTLRTWESKGGETTFQTETLGFHAGTYYIKISCNTHSTDAYSMQVDYTTASESDQFYEFEFNNTIDTANPLPVNTSCIGCIYSSDDTDYYTITLEEAGSLSTLFEHPEQYYTNSDYWKFAIIRSDGVVLQSWNSTGSQTRFQTNTLGYGAGTYFLKIESSNNLSTDNYTVKVNYTAASASEQLYESESNDSIADATVLPFNTPCIGNICNETDTDYYAVTLEEDSMIQITFQNPEQNYINSKYWNYTLMDSDGNALYSWDITGNIAAQQTPKMGFHPGTYYIKVMYKSNYSADNYTIKVTATTTSVFEAERNDTIATASSIPVATGCTGNLFSESDTDYYSFTLENNSNVSLKFTHAEEYYTNSVYWKIRLFDTNGNPLENWESKGGTTSMQTEEVSLSPGTYYFAISDGSYHSISNYTVQVNATEIPYTKGDVDADGDIDPDDAYLVLKAYASYSVSGKSELEGNAFLAADVDENENINPDDAYYILKYYATASVGGTPDWDALI